jgi:hypothetical protein
MSSGGRTEQNLLFAHNAPQHLIKFIRRNTLTKRKAVHSNSIRVIAAMFIHWEHCLLVDYPLIDDEHRMLLWLCRKLQLAATNDMSRTAIKCAYIELEAFAQFHLVSEENLMHEVGYECGPYGSVTRRSSTGIVRPWTTTEKVTTTNVAMTTAPRMGNPSGSDKASASPKAPRKPAQNRICCSAKEIRHRDDQNTRLNG